jgi:hypothetical protein
MSRLIALFGATALLLGCSFDPFVLQARAAAVCQHLPAQRFAVPASTRAQYALLPEAMQQGLQLERAFAFDVRAELPPELQAMLETQFALTSVRLTTVNAEDHLGFLEEAHLRLQPPPSSGLESRAFDYVRAEAAPRTVAWSGESFELTDYMQAGTLEYSVSLVGSLPPGDVVVDLEACAEVAVKLDAL